MKPNELVPRAKGNGSVYFSKAELNSCIHLRMSFGRIPNGMGTNQIRHGRPGVEMSRTWLIATKSPAMKNEVCSNAGILRRTWGDYAKPFERLGIDVEFSLDPLFVADHS